ncbi:hypothetical protein RR48_11317 [Papilio machaon]|uniref:Uncharacterized protein n=1 Tax=Papilio machaon TaxID=76193 RepID=A0A194QMQ5_PAPMA|nr:hypothetical protein RR48_11317 [Papilio machaon]
MSYSINHKRLKRSDTQGRSRRGDSEYGAHIHKTSSENPPGSHNHSYYRMARTVFMRERVDGERRGRRRERGSAFCDRRRRTI